MVCRQLLEALNQSSLFNDGGFFNDSRSRFGLDLFKIAKVRRKRLCIHWSLPFSSEEASKLTKSVGRHHAAIQQANCQPPSVGHQKLRWDYRRSL